MRLFLLPISTRRTLIYCQRLNVSLSEQQGILDKVTSRAAKQWASWEKKESGWQRKVVDYGNRALRGIPYEEWGLKSIPPLSARRKTEELSGEETVEVSFPSSLIPEHAVSDVLKKLGTERQKLHRTKMIYCLVGMPFTIPMAIVPVIPNLPFFYLVFRAWSHWRALSGSKHIEFLLGNKLVKPKPSPILDELYASGKLKFDAASKLSQEKSQPDLKDIEEEMVLHKSDGTRIAQALDLPELDIELDRAVWQVEKALQSAKDLEAKKRDSDAATSVQKLEAADKDMREALSDKEHPDSSKKYEKAKRDFEKVKGELDEQQKRREKM